MNDRDQISAVKCPQRIAILLERLAERMCPSARTPSCAESCRLRYFCKCAREQGRTALTLEIALCGAMAACGAGLIVYWVL